MLSQEFRGVGGGIGSAMGSYVFEGSLGFGLDWTGLDWTGLDLGEQDRCEGMWGGDWWKDAYRRRIRKKR